MENTPQKLQIEVRIIADPRIQPIGVEFSPKPTILRHQIKESRDPWFGIVKHYVSGKDWVTGEMVATECLKIDPLEYGRIQQMRIARILRCLGFERRPLWRNGKKINGWVDPSV